MLVALNGPVSPPTRFFSFPILFGFGEGRGWQREEKKMGQLEWSALTRKMVVEGQTDDRTQKRWRRTAGATASTYGVFGELENGAPSKHTVLLSVGKLIFLE